MVKSEVINLVLRTNLVYFQDDNLFIGLALDNVITYHHQK